MTLLLGPEGSAEARGSSPDIAIALSSGFLDMCICVLGQQERLCSEQPEQPYRAALGSESFIDCLLGASPVSTPGMS